MLTSQSDICDVFNNFFINVAKDIGKDSVPVDEPSIIEINKIRTGNEKDEFVFKHINEDFVDKQICKLSVKKAIGYDEISPKILKLAKPAVVKPITELINKSLDTSVFPAKLKIAQVVPVHKKNSTLHVCKGNLQAS